MSLSDLSIGDKMNLKSKLFELQKRLNVMNIQHELDEEEESITFQPILEAKNYKMHSRLKDFSSNVARSEAIRKQKLDMMKRTVEAEANKNFTFKPHLETSKHPPPKGRVPNKSICELRKEKGMIDGELPAERRARRIAEDEEATKALANSKKINPMSEKILKKKERLGAPDSKYSLTTMHLHKNDSHSRVSVKKELEDSNKVKKVCNKSDSILQNKFRRDINLLFRHLDSDQTGSICYDDIRQSVLANPVPHLHESSTQSAAELIWKILDKDGKGFITFPEFLEGCHVCKAEKSRAIKDKFSIFRDFVAHMIKILKDSLKEPRGPEWLREYDNPSYTPRIGEQSTKLANKVRAKEAQLYDRAYTNEYGDFDENDTVVTSNTKTSKDLTRYDHMMIRRKVALEKINNRKKELQDEEIKDCTFQPELVATYKSSKSSLNSTNVGVTLAHTEDTIVEGGNELEMDASSVASSQLFCPVAHYQSSDSHENGDSQSLMSQGESVFERLHYTKEYKDVPSKEIELELSECTFQPNIPSFSPERLQAPLKLPMGYRDAVSRMRESYTSKQRTQEEKINALFSFDNERYMRSRDQAAAGPKEFKFHEMSRGRRMGKQPPKLLIDVKIGAAKTVTIHVNDNDDPLSIATRFGFIYALDTDVVHQLEGMIRARMAEGGVKVGKSSQAAEKLLEKGNEHGRGDNAGGSHEPHDRGGQDDKLNETQTTLSDVSDDADYTVFSTPIGKLSTGNSPPVDSASKLLPVALQLNDIEGTPTPTVDRGDEEEGIDIVNDELSLF